MERDALANMLDLAALRLRLPDPATRRQLRCACGLTQMQLAEAAGISRVSVARYESGTRTPRGDDLRAYVTALDYLAGQIAAKRANGSGPVGTGPRDNTDERTGKG
jgi:transcriptional regulator with XRE-family HTH domain